jgi:hypothetical protein
MSSRLPWMLVALALAPSAGAAELPFGPRQLIAPAGPFDATFLAAVDVDGDWDFDLVRGGPYLSGGLVWHENTDAHGTFGPPQTIASSVGGGATLALADLDGDKDPDPIDSDFWHENAAGDGSLWVAHPMPASSDALAPVDLDRDGDVDLLVGSTWQENDGASPPGWTPPPIGTPAGSNLFGVSSVAAGDFDGDTDLDVVYFVRPWVCGSGCCEPGAVTWFESDGAEPPGLTLQVVDGPTLLPTAHAPFDVDLDGDLDLVLTDRDELVWYENLTEPVPALAGALRALLPTLLLAAAWRLRHRAAVT